MRQKEVALLSTALLSTDTAERDKPAQEHAQRGATRRLPENTFHRFHCRLYLTDGKKGVAVVCWYCTVGVSWVQETHLQHVVRSPTLSMSRFGVRAVLQFRRTSRRFAVRRARCVALVSAYAVLRLSSVRIELNILQAMKSRAGGASTAAAAAATWAENLGGGAGDHGRPGRQTCRAVWRDELAAFEVLQPRGDALRSMVRMKITCGSLYFTRKNLR